MKLVGELKKQVEETKNKEEAKEVIEKAGMQLTDDELDNVTGGQLQTKLDTVSAMLQMELAQKQHNDMFE